MTTAIAVDRFESFARAGQGASRTHAVALAVRAPLTRAQITGSLSLIDPRPIAIAPEPGLCVRVSSGCLRATQNEHDRIMGAGDRFVAAGSGTLVVTALEITEVHVEWRAREVAPLRAAA